MPSSDVLVRSRRALAAIVVFATLVASLAVLSIAAALPAEAADGDLSHVASASTAGNLTNHSVQIPNSVQAGDTLLLFMTTNSTTSTVSTPSGWTQIESVDGNGVRGRAWTRTATTGIVGTNVTVAASAAVKAVLSISAYRSTIGFPTVSASASSVVNTSASSHTTPTVAVAGANSWLVNYWGEKSSVTATWTLPDNATSRTTAAATGSGKVSAIVGDSNAPVGTGTAAGRTATTSEAVSRGVMFSVVVQPGSDTSPPTACRRPPSPPRAPG